MNYDARTQELLNILMKKKDMQLENAKLNILQGIVEYKNFSLQNIRLIKYQNSNAKIVHLYETWKKMSYPVVKKNSAIHILLPQSFRDNNKIVPQLRSMNVFPDDATSYKFQQPKNLYFNHEEVENFAKEVCKSLVQDDMESSYLILVVLFKLAFRIQVNKNELKQLNDLNEDDFLYNVSQLRKVFYRELNDISELEFNEESLKKEEEKNIQVLKEFINEENVNPPLVTTADRKMKLDTKLKYASERAEHRNDTNRKLKGFGINGL